ncbi:MAG: sodium:solute symporter, partial [Lachnospiraceae bacterium]|nr:sodium:solute symporter [Lachnospiraceae bacterium]
TFIFRNSLYSGVFCMLAGLVIVPIVSALTQKTLPSKVDDKFECFNATVTVHAKTSLSDED